MPHTVCCTPGSGNRFKPALVACQTGQTLAMRRIDVLADEPRQPAFLAINPCGHDFIADHGYRVADVAVHGCAHLAREGGFDLDRFPAVLDWMARVAATPRYQAIGDLLAG